MSARRKFLTQAIAAGGTLALVAVRAGADTGRRAAASNRCASHGQPIWSASGRLSTPGTHSSRNQPDADATAMFRGLELGCRYLSVVCAMRRFSAELRRGSLAYT
jgi:hypothetical protein